MNSFSKLRCLELSRVLFSPSKTSKTHLRPLVKPFHSSSASRCLDMEKVHTTERLRSLRELMKKHQVDIYGHLRETTLADAPY